MNEEFKDVVEETAENTVEQTAEEIVDGIELTDTSNTEDSKESNVVEKEEDSKPKGRFVTDDELNEIINKRVARKMNKLERDYESKYADYRDTEAVLNAGLGTSNIQEANKKMRDYYRSEGINVPDPVKPTYSEHDTEILAKAEANEIIEDGYDSMLEEANKLAQKGYANMNSREKIIFTTLGEKLTEEKDRKMLLKLGANEDLLKDSEFKEFRNQFNSNVSIETIYSLYKNKQPKRKFENPGSMKNNKTDEVKDFYTYEESLKYDRKDFEKNPELFKAIEKSMTKW
jgi:hypothetical protein